jgi:hypothetical protein
MKKRKALSHSGPCRVGNGAAHEGMLNEDILISADNGLDGAQWVLNVPFRR